MNDISKGNQSFEKVIENAIKMYKDLFIKVNSNSITLEKAINKVN
jgi:hypothetical protein